jgi:DNA invertase Pin-like site-specific DNA recombinase
MIRYAILAAVSTEQQAADDKVSLSEQETQARVRATAKGWKETGGPYIIAGESRTRFINLRDAETEIPPIHELLEAAKRAEYDVLVIYDYSRLRELLDPVARSLGAYNVQIYSISQPVDPIPPDQYDPYASDASNIIQTISGLTSRAEINALRRRWRIGVPRRIGKGLHPIGKPPYGYRKPPGRELDPSAPLVPDPVQAAQAVKVKDMYLSGQSIPQISAAMGLSLSRVRVVLANPFYAGLVRFGATQKHRDPRTGKSKNGKGKPITGPGLHQPLWDTATHAAILAEMQRRSKRYKGRHTQRLSLLLYCAEHGAPLRGRYSNDVHDDAHRLWYCPVGRGHWHLFIYDSAAIDRLSKRLVADLDSIKGSITLPMQQNAPDFSAGLKELEARRERLTDALEMGSLAPATYAERVSKLDGQINELTQNLESAKQAEQHRAERARGLQAIAQAITATPDFIRDAPAQQVNTALRALIARVLVDTEGMKIEYR